ncbi:MAG: 4Fe-4S cluster-binding domain-containing protein, partial [Clostridia bacterium]|nr:4Fe-4S cluster-binding domain-containing protein [Clostridia bacterium]
VKYLDVLVDGRFNLETRDVSLKWKGSPNQRVIDVPKSLNLGLVVLHS